MRVLRSVACVLGRGLVFLFYGALVLIWGGAIVGLAHGLLMSLIMWATGPQRLSLSFAFSLCVKAGVIQGAILGAVAGGVALGTAGGYRTARAEIARKLIHVEKVLIECARGAFKGGFICSLAGASTGGLSGLLWPLAGLFGWTPTLFDNFVAGYVIGAEGGFVLGLFVGALAPQGIATVKARLRAWWASPRLPEEER